MKSRIHRNILERRITSAICRVVGDVSYYRGMPAHGEAIYKRRDELTKEIIDELQADYAIVRKSKTERTVH